MIRRAFGAFRKRCIPTNTELMAKKWFRDGGDSKFRFDYDLDESSLVFDLGGYEGQWASDIFSMYQSHVFVFEPLREFADKIESRFRKNEKIKVFPFGLGRENIQLQIGRQANASSVYVKGDCQSQIEILDVYEWLLTQDVEKIDLMKINIEGGEFDLLERIIETKVIERIENVQVQFHDIIPNAAKRMESILITLEKTHSPTYQYRFLWENWKRKQ